MSWYEEDYEENEDGDSGLVIEYDISSIPNDFNINTIFNLLESGIIKIPLFQRNYVWDKKRASRLIESIVIGLPIPQIFLYEHEKNNWFVIDGQQRLMSIYFFVKQRFPKEKSRSNIRSYIDDYGKIPDKVFDDDSLFENFSLTLPTNIPNTINPLHGKKYSSLEDNRSVFDHLRTIRCIVIKQNTPEEDSSSMFEIFNRLNTGGLNLTSQEIRMSLFYSKFYKTLYELNYNKDWRNLLGEEQIDNNLKDMEIILRAFAILMYWESYKPTMTKFLNWFSKKALAYDEKMSEFCKQFFESFLKNCKELDARDFYGLNKKFNISLFEAVFVAVCEEAFKNKTLVSIPIKKGLLNKLKADDEFVEATQKSTTSKVNVEKRIKKAKAIFS